MASMAKPPARQENTECQPPVIFERHVPSDFPWQKLLLAIKHIVNTTTSFNFPKKNPTTYLSTYSSYFVAYTKVT